MTRPSSPPEMFRRRLVGLYALTLMEQEGPVHGYRVAQRVAQRTDGAWRPGPGAIYPSLRKLVSAGFARPRTAGRRREYAITAAGRTLLERIRSRSDRFPPTRLDVSALWAEVLGTRDLGDFLLLRLRRSLDGLEAYLTRPGVPANGSARLRADVRSELQRAIGRLGPGRRPPRPRRAAPGGSRG